MKNKNPTRPWRQTVGPFLRSMSAGYSRVPGALHRLRALTVAAEGNEGRARSLTVIAGGIGEILVMALLALGAPLIVAIDIVVIGHEVVEISLTELTQEALLLTSALLFWYSAWRSVQSRGFLVLVAGLFSCMLVRELDGFLDYVWHGFWFWPAILIAIVSIACVLTRHRDTVLGPMSDFIDTKPYFYIMFGLTVVLVFSRVFGSGTLLWKPLMGAAYDHDIKSALQEGLELFGYLIIAYGSFLFFRGRKPAS